ncbi:MAG TPA: zinc-binding dehydrogenase [Ktedonobacteraceae bacterium]|nr:zinc-binding dehydrogenase [Ktedonobacteraceae bacterium]
MYKNLSVTGYWLSAWMSRPDRIAAATMELMKFLATGTLQIIVGQTFPLAEAAEAHRAIILSYLPYTRCIYAAGKDTG